MRLEYPPETDVVNELVPRLIASLLIVAILPLAGGCAAALIGGAAAGGYYVGKDERSAGQISKDGVTTTTVKARLIDDRYVDATEIKVETYNSIVTLTGDVASASVKQRAGDIAGGAPDVVEVKNELWVRPES